MLMRWIISEIAIVANRIIRIVIILVRYLPLRPRGIGLVNISPTLYVILTLCAECVLLIKGHIADR
jgi:hypothetical protein